MKRFQFVIAALLLSACETVPSSAPPPPGVGGPIAEGPLELGNWRNASEAATLSAFEQNVSSRYGAGVTVSDAAADLRRHDFSCGDAPPQDEQGRGEPPAQVCRRTVTESNCTHTWQAHLFEGDGRVVRTRGLYDRRCGSEGLLGGPG
jgi:hypothetical protein